MWSSPPETTPSAIHVNMCDLRRGPLDGYDRWLCVVDMAGRNKVAALITHNGRQLLYVGSRPQDGRIPRLVFEGYVTK